jgi:hypothetical protein
MAQKRFNDLVTFVRNGSAIPALVVNSQLQPDGREFLSLLYADPVTGPTLVISGASRKVGDVALSVAPLRPNGGFGWFDLPVTDAHAAVLDEHANAAAASQPAPKIDPDLVGTPGVHVPLSQRQALESDSDKESRLANLAFQHPAPVVVPADVVAQEKEEAAGSGTGRYGDGADHWTQTGDGTDYPGSYGVGPVATNFAPGTGSDGQPLKPFVPFDESEPVPADPSGLTGPETPVIETKQYSDGSSATGIAPVPDLSPAQQDESAASEPDPTAPATSGDGSVSPEHSDASQTS